MSKAVRRVLIGGLVAFVAYPLSLAPLDRAIFGPPGPLPSIAAIFDIADVQVHPRVLDLKDARGVMYRPVLFLIDYTWASEPLLLWGDLWGVGEAHRHAAVARQANRFYRAIRDGELP